MVGTGVSSSLLRGKTTYNADVYYITYVIHNRLKWSRLKICRTRPFAGSIWEACIDFSDAIHN